MSSSLLFLHSWVRWLAIAGVLFVVVRALRGVMTGAPWTKSDSTWIKGAAHLMTTQVVLGILLYAVSPFMRGLLDNMGATMKDPATRFFAVEHGVAMLIALGLTHMGSAMARKAPTDSAKHKRALIFFGIAILVIGYAVPWSRPLIRA